MKKEKYLFGIVLLSNPKPEQYMLDQAGKEYDLTKEELAQLKEGRLFRLSDYFEYIVFDADHVLVDEEKETYYQLEGFSPMRIENRDSVIALIDENAEATFIR